MKSYTAKYRQPGQIFWRKCKRVIGDVVLENCRCLHLEDDRVIYISYHAEVIFSKERQAILLARAEKEAGHKIPRA